MNLGNQFQIAIEFQKIYGKNTYRLSNSEIKYRNLTRRVFVAKTDIKKKEF